MSEDTGDKQKPEHLFKPGQSGNPNGRPKGARSKLGEQFLEDLYASWQANGAETLEKVRTEKPDQYVKVVASILPKELSVKVSELDELSDADIDRRIDMLARALHLEIGAGQAPRGAGEAEGPKQTH